MKGIIIVLLIGLVANRSVAEDTAFGGSVAPRMDKPEYKNVFEAVKTHTGKEVEFLGDSKDRSKKEDKEEDKEKDKRR